MEIFMLEIVNRYFKQFNNFILKKKSTQKSWFR